MLLMFQYRLRFRYPWLDGPKAKYGFLSQQPILCKHCFLGLEKDNIVLYSCNNYRDKKSEVSILWNDKELNINWGIKKPIISNKDKNALSFKMFKNKFIK